MGRSRKRLTQAHMNRKGATRKHGEEAKNCPICDFFGEDSLDLKAHLETPRHLYNFMLKRFKTSRKRMVQDRHKVTVTVNCSTHSVEQLKDGTAKTKIKPEDTQVEYHFEISNSDLEKPVLLQKAQLMHPYSAFTISDEHNISSGETYARIHPESAYKVKVSFKNCGIGTYGVPVCMWLMKKKNNDKERFFQIIRVMVVNVVGPQTVEPLEIKDSPFTGERWWGMEQTVWGRMPDGKRINRLTAHSIPREFTQVVRNKFLPWKGITEEETIFLLNTCKLLQEDSLCKENYTDFFTTLLYLEEYDSREKLEQYNMAKVPLKIVMEDRVELEVPGLAEKRPSVVKGDKVLVRVYVDDLVSSSVQFEGVVAEVRETVVWLSGFDNGLMIQLEDDPTLLFDVKFVFSRYPIYVMHRALELLEQEGLKNLVYPDPQDTVPPRPIELGQSDYFNPLVKMNPEQKAAVENILRGTSRPAPYIIFGPPGTGKTVTVVEAILQVKKRLRSRILVCAPSNAACDHLTQRLISFGCTKSELLRLHSSSRDIETVPQDIYPYSNMHKKICFYQLRKDELVKYRIIVCTLISSSRLVPEQSEDDDVYHKKYPFTHIFVDECAQAQEPESLVPVAGILEPPCARNPGGGQLVLAGDPLQLGPVCNSMRAQQWLEVSLLERLMSTCELYKRNTEEDGYDNRFITKLIQNFRSHPDILYLPNELFYDGDLIDKCGPEVRQDPLLSTFLLSSKKPGRAVVFHGVIGYDQREGKSPSHFNTYEVGQVMWYMNHLLGSEARVAVKQSEIGIIAPYIRQVYKLKKALQEKSWDQVEVGTTETFQGREKRVIIISTVRSNRNLLDYDGRFRLGFLVNQKRFNVAVTRARSLLIVVGNPHLLEKDKNWRALIQLTQLQLDSYKGCKFHPLDDTWVDQVMERMSTLKLAEEDE